ncbi:MAG: porin, partial [Halothiobacillaceae bacterium]
MKPPIGLVAFLLLTAGGTAAFAGGPAPPAQDASPASPYLPTLSLYAQVRYTDVDHGDDAWAIRRLKLMLDGGPEGGLRYHVQFIYKTNLQSSTDDQVFLQDAYVILPASRNFAFKAGQFVPPFGLERFQPDWKLDLVDRTDVTNRMVVNGNLGKSFARDRGVEADWTKGGFSLSAGLFQGEGANMNPKGNGPLVVVRLSYGGKGGADGSAWLWRAGLAASDRHDSDMNLSAEFPGLNPKLTSHFDGRDSRINAFAEAGAGKVRGQAEYFRAWLSPDRGGEIAARGAYAQVAYLPVAPVILALRYETFTPDVHEPGVASQDLWTAGVTVDVPKTSLRLACDYSHPTTAWPKTRGDVVR